MDHSVLHSKNPVSAFDLFVANTTLFTMIHQPYMKIWKEVLRKNKVYQRESVLHSPQNFLYTQSANFGTPQVVSNKTSGEALWFLNKTTSFNTYFSIKNV